MALLEQRCEWAVVTEHLPQVLADESGEPRGEKGLPIQTEDALVSRREETALLVPEAEAAGDLPAEQLAQMARPSEWVEEGGEPES